MIENNGRRIGLMGLIEREWLATLATVDEEDTNYEDFVVCAKRCVARGRLVEMHYPLSFSFPSVYIRVNLDIHGIRSKIPLSNQESARGH